MRPPAGSLSRTLTDSASLTQGQSFRNSQLFNSSGIAAGDYLVVLQGDINGTIQTVASAPLRITSVGPIANAGPDQQVITGSQVSLNGSGSYDPGGDAITYLWSLSSKTRRRVRLVMTASRGARWQLLRLFRMWTGSMCSS